MAKGDYFNFINHTYFILSEVYNFKQLTKMRKI